MWRWSWYFSFVLRQLLVFSTYVEVILPVIPLLISPIGILHVCGGDPNMKKERLITSEYSPRMWRWSSLDNTTINFNGVFSTYVEVILMHNIMWVLRCWYSPRMWRWSYFDGEELGDIYVFSTYVEVILKAMQQSQQMQSILHVCGGDPNWRVEHRRWCRYSPRMWRWSLRGIDQKETITVFSTHVESVTVLERTDK